MALGVGASIAVKQISGVTIEDEVNRWLLNNKNYEVLDIKFATSAHEDNWESDALIIYRKES